MATNKKSVLLYCDIIHTVSELSNEEAGKLFKHYLQYINDLNPTPPDKLTQIVFEPIKQNLKRDLKKWEQKSERNKESALVRWSKQNDANASERIKQDAKHADKDTVTVKVIDTVKDKDIYREFKHLKLSHLDFKKLIDAGNSKELIDDILNRIENYAKNTSYTNLYLTCLNWITEDKKRNPTLNTKPAKVISYPKK